MPYKVLDGLKPETLWKRFGEICEIPHPSKKEEKILEHLKSLCVSLNVEYKQDDTGNLCIIVPATKGYENSKKVILQAHVDMVCEKNKGTEHDFDNDPLNLTIKDGWLKAVGTTLGADNGIGVAAALSIITDETAIHGPIEILLTVDEETGLTGANQLKSDFVSGTTMLNLDSEEDGVFYIGCSGGMGTNATLNIDYTDVPSDYVPFEIFLSGLKGGHSGLEIHLGKGNAIKLMSRLINTFSFDFYLAYIQGGNKRNAIPREAEAKIFVKKNDIDLFKLKIKEVENEFVDEFKTAEPDVKISATEIELNDKKAFNKNFTVKLLKVLLACPHGVVNLSQDIAGLVETSTNLAIIETLDSKISLVTTQRSSIESAKQYIAASTKSVFELGGAEISIESGYPGWKPNMDSPVLQTAKDVYFRLFNEQPEIKAIHAGLECGILGDRVPGLDMVSFGPTITGPHSPDERVNIETVDKFYFLLKELLKELAIK